MWKIVLYTTVSDTFSVFLFLKYFDKTQHIQLYMGEKCLQYLLCNDFKMFNA